MKSRSASSTLDAYQPFGFVRRPGVLSAESMTDFKTVLDRHVAELTSAILGAITQLSMNELMALSTGAPVRAAAPAAVAAPASRRASLADVVELLSDHQGGLRSEQIRESLDFDRKDMPRILAEGLESQALVKSGERRSTLYFARWPAASAAPAAAAVDEPSETESSILEHLNEAGPKGSNLKAWIISTQGELEADEHAKFEREGLATFHALEKRGTITSRNGGPARGTVYALAPAS